jgi:hypothetical protein
LNAQKWVVAGLGGLRCVREREREREMLERAYIGREMLLHHI